MEDEGSRSYTIPKKYGRGRFDKWVLQSPTTVVFIMDTSYAKLTLGITHTTLSGIKVYPNK